MKHAEFHRVVLAPSPFRAQEKGPKKFHKMLSDVRDSSFGAKAGSELGTVVWSEHRATNQLDRQSPLLKESVVEFSKIEGRALTAF
jgi:hypothetical protein